MDPSHINHAQAWAWQQKDSQMSNDVEANNVQPTSSSSPMMPDQSMPDNPMIPNTADQNFNISGMPSSNDSNGPPQFQQMAPGGLRMGARMDMGGMGVQPGMQTPTGINTGMFVQAPLPYQQFMQQSALGLQPDPSTMFSPNLPMIPDQLAVPSLEAPTFNTSGSILPQSMMDNPFVPQGMLGQMPNPPMPQPSLFMQPMAPPGGMPQHIMMMQNPQGFQMGGFRPGIQMRPTQGRPMMSRAHPMHVPQMNVQTPGTPQMQLGSAPSPMQISHLNMPVPGTPQMRLRNGPSPMMQVHGNPQAQFGNAPSPMQISQTDIPTSGIPPMQLRSAPSPMQTSQHDIAMSGIPQAKFGSTSNNLPPMEPPGAQGAPPPVPRVRFEGVPTFNPNINVTSHQMRPRVIAPMPASKRDPIHQNTGPSSQAPDSAPFLPVPKAVIGVSEEPISRTYPPQQPKEKLKTGKEPPSETQYDGGKMSVKDYRTYMKNMTYLGKPTGTEKERLHAPLKALGHVPLFAGDLNDFPAVRAHLNALTRWANQCAHITADTMFRYDIYADALADDLHAMKEARKEVLEAIKEFGDTQGHGKNKENEKAKNKENDNDKNKENDVDMDKENSEDKEDEDSEDSDEEDPKIPDPSVATFIRNAKLNKIRLEGVVNLLAHHHRSCPNAPKDIYTFENLSGEVKTAVDLQKEMTDRRTRELETLQNSLKLKSDMLERARGEMKESNEEIAIYQIQIEEIVNENNFIKFQKGRAVQKLLDIQEAAKRLQDRYQKLFTKAAELSKEVGTLKTMLGWVGQMPDLTEEQHQANLENILQYRYQVLLDNTRCVIAENSKMREQLRAETSIQELQNEYNVLKAEKERFQAELQAQASMLKNTQELPGKIGALEKQLKAIKVRWSQDKAKWDQEKTELQREVPNWKSTYELKMKENDAALATKQKEFEKTIEELQKSLAEEKELREGHEKSYNELRTRYGTLNKMRNDAKIAWDQAQDKIKYLEEKYETGRKQHMKLTKLCEEAIDSNDQLTQTSAECQREKQELETKTSQLMEVHKRVLEENAHLKERRLLRKVELEALKQRLKENGPEKIIRVTEGPAGVARAEALLTLADLLQLLGREDFRRYMLAHLKAKGDIKDE
ncbi:hypothetical protein TWF730_002338 [Orbilia blumenaviensis]|uniref:Uncharacterized protein n=1 Tax=Orbilia blumenaviensis TaxID=1796055 RepID=A0AAV9UE18_9PEZI